MRQVMVQGNAGVSGLQLEEQVIYRSEFAQASARASGLAATVS